MNHKKTSVNSANTRITTIFNNCFQSGLRNKFVIPEEATKFEKNLLKV